MKKLLTIQFCFLASTVFSQHHTTTIKKVGLTWLSISGNYNDFTNLNKKLSSYSSLYTLAPKKSIGFHFGIEGNSPNRFTKFQFGFYTGSVGKGDKKSSSLFMSDISYDFGYKLIKTNSMSLSPFVGISLNNGKISLTKDLSSISMDSILTSSSAQQYAEVIRFRNSFFNYRTGLAFYFLDKKEHNPLWGVTVGYIGGFSNSDWRYNQGQVLNNAVSDKLGMFYIDFSVCSSNSGKARKRK